MADIILSPEENKKKLDALNIKVNSWLNKQTVSTPKQLVSLAKKLVQKSGGQIFPAHESKAKKLGFVWALQVYDGELVANPLVPYSNLSEEELNAISFKLLRANK